MVVHVTSHKPFSWRVADADRHLSFERFQKHFSTILFYGLTHLAVPSPSFPSWQLSLTENQVRSVCTLRSRHAGHAVNSTVQREAILEHNTPTLLLDSFEDALCLRLSQEPKIMS